MMCLQAVVADQNDHELAHHAQLDAIQIGPSYPLFCMSYFSWITFEAAFNLFNSYPQVQDLGNGR